MTKHEVHSMDNALLIAFLELKCYNLAHHQTKTTSADVDLIKAELLFRLRSSEVQHG